MKVLVLDSASSGATAAIQDLGKIGAKIHAIALAPHHDLGSRYVSHRFAPQRDPTPDVYGCRLEELQEAEAYDLIIPSSEISLRAIQALGAGHPLRPRAVLASHESVEITLDKTRTHKLATRLDLPVPTAKIIQRDRPSEATMSYPLVLKPVISQVLVDGVYQYAQPTVVRDDAEYEWFLERWLQHTPVEEQNFIEGQGWGVGCLYNHGELVWHFTHERVHEWPLTGGASSYRRSVRTPDHLLEISRQLLDALEWHGIAMVEFRVHQQTGLATLMEINPRPWGSMPLAFRSGVHFPRGLLTLASGRRPSPRASYRTDFFMRSLQKDAQWMRANWMADQSDPLTLTRPRVTSLLEWLRVLGRTEEWDHFSWRDPEPGMRQIAMLFREFIKMCQNRATGLIEAAGLRRLHRANLDRWRSTPEAHDNIHFICFGNICRSPYAAHAARARFESWSASSSGLHATPGRESPDRIQRLASANGVDLSSHRARTLHDTDIEAATLLVVMDPNNLSDLLARFPQAREKVVLLGLLADQPQLSVPDPISLDHNGITLAFGLIEDAVSQLSSLKQP